MYRRTIILLALVFFIPGICPADLSIQPIGPDNMPITFTRNDGQWDFNVKYRAQARDMTLWFAEAGIYYHFINEDLSSSTENNDGQSGNPARKIEYDLIKAEFIGSNPCPEIYGESQIGYLCNYMIGDDPAQWHVDVPNFLTLRYDEVYPGISLTYYGSIDNYMEYDFEISPGADYTQIQIQYTGTKSLAINNEGDLEISTTWGKIIEKPPYVYQIDGGLKHPIESNFILYDENTVGFSIEGNLIAELPVTIDPYMIYSTYVGGNNLDTSFAIDIDNNGYAYIAGITYSTNFPTLDPYQTDQANYDAFVTKLDVTGSSLVYSTYLGGNDIDYASGIAVDDAGCAYITGETESTDFPLQNPYLTDQDHDDAFITKLNDAGNGLIYSTYFGGSGNDHGTDIDVDPNGNVYVTGITRSYSFFPLLNYYQGTLQGSQCLYAAKLNNTGSALVYSTYLGGSGYEWYSSIACDDDGYTYIVGNTASTNYPTLNEYQTDQGDNDAVITKIDINGSNLIFSTYLGSSGWEGTRSKNIAIDKDKNVYVVGSTRGDDFPTVNPYRVYSGSHDMFVSKLDNSGSSLHYSTYLGGNSDFDVPFAIDVDSNGFAYVTGWTSSTDYPLVNPIQGDGGLQDVFITKLDSSGSSLVYSTYLGGGATDQGYDLVIGDRGDLYVTGVTSSTDFPRLNEYQSNQAEEDAFVVKIVDTLNFLAPMTIWA